ncbi:MarR family winged helix-turn-helix transcriptional regulator [Solibacillus daqui]|uniref:MarR family winged helix-turn-helix transcriptional regulator n=1 Tax=Solibacillus daqui TaxID=2912187 RepID=UPI003B75B804
MAEKGSIRMNELARILGIKARSVTDFVDALEQVVRQPDPNDLRAILLQLTDLAKTHLDEVRVLQNEITDRLLENIPVDQHGVLLGLLKRLNKEKYQATNID